MASETKPDTSRSVAQVYVPTYQRDAWDEHADELDMSRSEFVRTMVQAGRRGFGADPAVESAGAGDRNGADQSMASLEDRILEALETRDCLSWEELLAAVTGDIESRLETQLQELQDEGRVRHSGREGGYVVDR